MKAWCFVFVLVLGLAGTAHAQQRARRLVAAGEVTGLEMSIDGSLHAPPGGHVRWLVTTFEVLRRRDLRVAGGIQLTVTASFADGPALTSVVSDATGHAVLDFELPASAEHGFQMSVEAVSPRGIRRVFDAPIALDAPSRIELLVDRDFVPRGASVVAFGRVLSLRDGRPSAGEHVSLSLRAGTLVRAPIELVTDASGFFAGEVTMPEVAATYFVGASAAEASADAVVVVSEGEHAALWARAEPQRAVVRPAETVPVDVLVRAEDGAPIAGARIEWADAPPAADDPVVRTDASGHASLPWVIDRYAAPGESFEDRERSVHIVHAAHGSINVLASVRIARPSVFVTWSVEGGSLVRGLGSRLFVRTTNADGSPRPSSEVALAAGALGDARTATTDADGVAVLDVTLAETHEDASGCGGPTAVLAALEIDHELHEACLPIEPDALLAVRALARDASIDVMLARRPEARDHAVAIVALAKAGDTWEPIARVLAGPRDASATLALPTHGAAPIWVRARVVYDGQETMGGGTVVYAGHAADAGAITADAAGAHAPSASAIVAMDAGSAFGFEQRLAGLTTPLGLAIAEGRSDRFVLGLAASMVPRDTAAPAVRREGSVAPLAMPDDAVAQGLLRDPWRTRARFVRGRLGAMMRAVEQLVDASVPDTIDEVGVQDHGAWHFDREMLEAAMIEAGLGDERAAALDGEPLDIDALTAMDPSFTYDHVARRLTRERLYRMLWFLRQLVRERQLDLAWARRGDPAEYPVSLLESSVGFTDEYPTRTHLFDGWGHPFVLVPVHGHARFDRFQPVPGYELVSGGPDGHVGNADDVFDPFARVLASGSVYAEAVQEDELVARLGSVELGRATVQTLAEAFAYSTRVDYDVTTTSATLSWGREPTRLSPAAPALADIPRVKHALFGLGASASWTPPDERRAYVAFGVTFAPDGGTALRSATFEAGAPFLARVETPTLLRVGDALRVPIRFVQLTSGAAPEPSAEASASTDALGTHVEGDALVIEARHPGISRIALVVHASGAPDYHAETLVRVLPTGSLRAAHTGAMGTGTLDLDLRVPSGASPWRARWVVGAPTALRRDPLFAGSAHDAALAAWADALAGATPDPEDMAALENAVITTPSGLHTACALVAWAIAGDPVHDPHFAIALANLPSTVPTDLPARAAMLAALAPAAPAIGDTSSGLPAVVASLREDAWRALATERDHPTTLAEMAAALLLVDRDDAVARVLFDRARAAATDEGFPADTADGLAGTLALVIAARQIDQDALADTLANAVLSRLYLTSRLGLETRFWALAASSFGALGGDPIASATLEVDGVSRELSLDEGAVVLDDIRPGARVRVRSTGRVWARGEVRAMAEYGESTTLAVSPRVEGDVGALGERAGLELAMESTSDAEISAPVVELAIPSGATLDASALASIRSAAAVSSVEGPDGAGVLRIFFVALRGRGTYRVPLPLRWRASGHSQGLGIVVYDRARPWLLTTAAERSIEVSAP